jgi:transmembrane sensor
MKSIEAKELLRKYTEGTCNEEEKYVFEQWFNSLNREDRVQLTATDLEETEKEMLGVLLDKIHKPKRSLLWPRIAAAMLIIFSIGGYFVIHKRTTQQTAQTQTDNQIVPGTNKAMLTLSNGKQISLSDAQNGTLSIEGSQLVKKADNGTVSYENNGSSDENYALTYNTIATPRGGQWSVILPDGTRVMLDATSSIKYPLKFIGKERNVDVTGQAYFEVAHNPKMPFRVRTANQVIEVLGTHFNVNVYTDEPDSRVTLLEGRVKISKGINTAILKPGQQAITANGTNNISVKKVDADNFVAWKTGRFYFNNADIETVMRQLSRWYDVQVSYKGTIPQQQFNGDIQRNLKATQLLDILSNYYNIPFKIEGKRIIIGE